MTRPVAIVTGGARGIGHACVEALADIGFNLLVADIADEAGRSLSDEMVFHGARSVYHRCDIADLSAHQDLVDAAINAYGRIDCLVNNAGIGAPVRGDLLDLEPGNFDRVLDVNLRGTVFLSQAVARAMLGTETGHARSIITVTSVSAHAASPERADYCVSKAALSMWVKNLALRLASDQIGVFEVRPGIVRTDMTAAVTEKYDKLIGDGLVPAGRWGEASDVGRAVAALASGAFGFATGSIINIDGALSVPRL